MELREVPAVGNWREDYVQAQFRDAIFFVETDSRSGGRRVAVHQYPKRNVPYAEDMGRTAVRITVQGYLISNWGRSPAADADTAGRGRQGEPIDYRILKNNLIEALERDGPGWLRLPMQYLKQDI